MPQTVLQDRIKAATEEVSAGLPLRQEHVDVLGEAAREAAARLGGLGIDLFGLVHVLSERIAVGSKGAAMLGVFDGLLDSALRNNVTASALSGAFGRPYWDARLAGSEDGAPEGA